MITDQPVTNHSDMHRVTDNMLREVGLTIRDGGGKVTFAGKEPVRKTVMKAGAAPAIILAANAVAEAAIWKERTGEGQDIHVDLRQAWIEQSPWQFDAVPYTLVNGAAQNVQPGLLCRHKSHRPDTRRTLDGDVSRFIPRRSATS